MTPRIQKAIDIFLDAINEGTLAKGTCAACAVGNLVANGLGIKAVIPDKFYNKTKENEYWIYDIVKLREYGMSMFNMDKDKSRKCIESTDFTIEELEIIERVFEQNTKIGFNLYNTSVYTKEKIRKDQINGLKAVIEEMLKFDNCRENVKEVFTDKAELIII